MAKVREKFSSTTYNHYISFVINPNKIFPIKDLCLGKKVKFISKEGKEYHTVITSLRYSGTSDSIEIKLGLNRVTLTDKLLMKDK